MKTLLALLQYIKAELCLIKILYNLLNMQRQHFKYNFCLQKLSKNLRQSFGDTSGTEIQLLLYKLYVTKSTEGKLKLRTQVQFIEDWDWD